MWKFLFAPFLCILPLIAEMSRDPVKQAVGYAAAELVQPGMRVGLGTGSTVFYFIERLGQRCREGLCIEVAASSQQSYQQALEEGLSLLDMNALTALDLTVDGADEVDPEKRLIKGGGGALLREKILASMSRELVIIVDASKCVQALGKFKLPVEVVPFANEATLCHIQEAGYTGTWRLKANGELYVTDNGNFIVDVHFVNPTDQPERDHETLLHIPGVVDTGFFFNLANSVLVGHPDGQVTTF